MKTKTILMALAFATMFAGACSRENINEETDKKGFALPVTVNVTREGDDATKATYNETSKKLEFSAGDKLFVFGNDNSVGGAGRFAGTLDMVSAGTFSGTIHPENSKYTGTADDLLSGFVSAVLLPAGYTDYNYLSIKNDGTYSAEPDNDNTKAFALTKAAAVEQFSYEMAMGYSGGFVLSPASAILNFTISGLTPLKTVDVALTRSGSLTINGSVTTDGSGTATFAVGVVGKTAMVPGTDFINLALTVDGNDITLASGSKELVAGKVYNVNRSAH